MSMTTSAKRLVRKTARSTSSIWDPVYVAVGKRRNDWSGPVPPLENRLRVSGPGVGHFIKVGRALRDLVLGAIDDYGQRRPGLKVLDFGAGVGRTLFHLDDQGFELHATDVDPTAMAYLRKHCPGIDVRVNDYGPPLTYQAETFDVVYSISIWTHLPVDAQMPWLVEMRRVLKPGGLALLTVAGFRGLAVLRDRDPVWADVTDEDLRAAGTLYKEYPAEERTAKRMPGVTGSYGLTAHSPDYIREHWPAAGFDVLEVRGTSNQDLVILRAV